MAQVLADAARARNSVLDQHQGGAVTLALLLAPLSNEAVPLWQPAPSRATPPTIPAALPGR